MFRVNYLLTRVFCTAAVCMLLVSYAGADVITTAAGCGADTHIWYRNPNTNGGTGSVVGIKSDTFAIFNSRKGYFRFDISDFAGPIESVAFELVYAGKGSDSVADPSTYYVYGLNNGHAGEAWSETGITWNNAPGNNRNSRSGVLAAEASLLGTFDIHFSAIDVGYKAMFESAALLDFVKADTDGLVTLIVGRQQRNFRVELFASKEHALLNAPALNIVPEPATLSFLALGGTALLRRRQKA